MAVGVPCVPCRIGVLPLGWPPRLPWHWPQARLKTNLPADSRSFSAGSGSGSGLVPAAMASASAFTLGDENFAFWKLARSSRKLAGGSTVIPAWLRSALSAWFCSVSMRPSSW